MFNIGETVLAYWKGNDAFHIGTIVQQEQSGFLVVFEDGDSDIVPAEKIKKFQLEPGMKVFAMFRDRRFYPASISHAIGRAIFVNFDDGDKGWTSYSGIAVK